MPRTKRYWILLTVLMTGLIVAVRGRATELKPRPAAWATGLERPGLPNLHKLNDGLYRGAQPEPDGIKELEKLGIKTIICLRSAHSDKEILGAAKIAYEAIPMDAWNVKEEDAIHFLQLVTDKSRQPVFVHCQHGADRTGAMCAVYRIVVDGWTKQQAIDEMTQGGFRFHPIWTNLVPFVNGLDAEKIRDKAGLKKKEERKITARIRRNEEEWGLMVHPSRLPAQARRLHHNLFMDGRSPRFAADRCSPIQLSDSVVFGDA